MSSMRRVGGSPVSTKGGSSIWFAGMKASMRRTSSRHSCSPSTENCAAPDLALCDIAPPSSSCVVFSPVTASITSGPVMNICEVPLTMKMKSVIAGE